MAFFFGLIFGIAWGIGIVAAFARLAAIRANRRSELARTVAAFARMKVDDSKKILPSSHYPTWVVFTQQQKLNWLNLLLDKIWPFVDEATSELIRSNVEPLLEQYRPVVLASLRFSKLTLGKVAPQLTGISILEGEREHRDGSVVMEFELQWDGTPNIVLDVKTRLGVSLPIQVKDIGFTGVFRLIFKPLVDEFPCFGAVAYSLRDNKDLDFKLKIIKGDVTSLPGVSDAIEDTIRDAIEDSITWPVRNIVAILPGDYSDLELKPMGTLEVKLIEARGLTNKDLVGKSDPYAELFVRPLRTRTKKSKIIDNDLNPIWNEHFEFIVEDDKTQSLTIKILDDEGVKESELLGCARLMINDLEPAKVKDVWLALVKDLDLQRDTKNRGDVHLEIMYMPIGAESAIKNPFNPYYSLTTIEKTLTMNPKGTGIPDLEKAVTQKIKKDFILRGVLSVTVISAEALPAADYTGKSDPFVVLRMKKSETKAKTRVLQETLNPVWNQTFDFVVEDALHDLLMMEVFDHDTFGKDKLGRVIMTLTRVIQDEEFTDSFPLQGAKTGKLNLNLKWSAQPVPLDR